MRESFRAAIAKAQALEVPESMREVHARYLEALALYENAAEEMVEAARDGRDDRLIEAQGMSFRASEDALRVGDVLWPGRVQAALRRWRRQTAAAFGWQQRLRSNGEDQLMKQACGSVGDGGPYRSRQCRRRARPGGDRMLGLAGREQPVHERALRLLHARPRVRAGQHQPEEQHQHGRPAGQHRRDQVRRGADPVRCRLEAAGLSQDDGLGPLGRPCRSSSSCSASVPTRSRRS